MDHKRGSLAAVLNVKFAKNLTKFNRCKGRNAMEIFFVDVTFEKYAIMLKQKRC
jgi:hypothetical protein